MSCIGILTFGLTALAWVAWPVGWCSWHAPVVTLEASILVVLLDSLLHGRRRRAR